MVKIEVGDRDRAIDIFRLLDPSPVGRRDIPDEEVYRLLDSIIEQLEKKPSFEPEVEPTWFSIPSFTNYEISKTEGVRNRFTKRVLKEYMVITQLGETPFVEMHDANGYLKPIAMSHIHELVFKETKAKDGSD